MIKKRIFLSLIVLFLILTSISFTFATEPKPIELNEDNPERIIDFIIEEIEGTVNINYIDNENNKLLPSESFKVGKGEHTYKAKTINKYNILGNSVITVEIIKNNEIVVVEFIYSKIKEPEVKEPEPPIIEPEVKESPIVKPVIDKIEPAKILGNIKGYIVFDDGTGLNNARLELHSNIKTTYTDEKGYFEFLNIELGNHQLYLADDEYSKELILLESLIIYEDTNMLNEFKELSFNNGIFKTAQVNLTKELKDKEIKLVVKLGEEKKEILGKITIKYIHSGKEIKTKEIKDLDLKSYTIKPEEIDNYILASNNPIEVILTEDNPEQIISFELNIVEDKINYLPLLSIPLLLILFIFVRKKHIGIYAIDNGNFILIKKKRIKHNSEIINITLDKEIKYMPDVLNFKIVIFKNIARKINKKQINIILENELIETGFIPQSINQDFEILVNIEQALN